MAWRIFGGYSQRNRDDRSPELAGAAPVVERLLDGPVLDALDIGAHTDRRWSIGGRLESPPRERNGITRRYTAGVDIGGAQSLVGQGFNGVLTELVDTVAARRWSVTSPSVESNRHATTLAAFANYQLEWPGGVTIDAGLRYDGVSGSADGATQGVSWHSVLGRAGFRWTFNDRRKMSLFAGFAQSADQLPLGMLAVGDPNAPFSLVSRAGAPPGVLAPIVARVGPGTGGDPAFSAIDPDLARPRTNEIVVGVEARPRDWLRVRLWGVDKRQHNLMQVVDTGLPASGYAVIYITDSIASEENPEAVQQLPVYNRLPSSFGRDRYLLTNPEQDSSTMDGLVLSAEASAGRWWVLFGATAMQTDGPAASRGFHAEENDIGLLGEVSANPNAATFARDRLFTDRAFTIKWSTVYRFDHDVRLGVIARYQDGQPFSRVVVVRDLNQGSEFIRAYSAGNNTRFMFTGTLDVRLQKGFAVGRGRVDAILDGYNVMNLGNEVEERIVTGPGFRTITAIQPPIAIQLGVRWTF